MARHPARLEILLVAWPPHTSLHPQRRVQLSCRIPMAALAAWLQTVLGYRSGLHVQHVGGGNCSSVCAAFAPSLLQVRYIYGLH